ncbi:BA75_00095T0 [Komagataella pastoris]|uniref:BA75_00095T0 n=1 Tax=Komagataella pastoris TaxID=4922 RepID=A0A1B2J567_PICPA|nr:BA75_00095T0 [Komagataella pastoris]
MDAIPKQSGVKRKMAAKLFNIKKKVESLNGLAWLKQHRNLASAIDIVDFPNSNRDASCASIMGSGYIPLHDILYQKAHPSSFMEQLKAGAFEIDTKSWSSSTRSSRIQLYQPEPTPIFAVHEVFVCSVQEVEFFEEYATIVSQTSSSSNVNGSFNQ